MYLFSGGSLDNKKMSEIFRSFLYKYPLTCCKGFIILPCKDIS